MAQSSYSKPSNSSFFDVDRFVGDNTMNEQSGQIPYTDQERLIEMRWFLHGSDGEESSPRDMAINAIPYSIGRRFDLNLTLKSRSVSGLHAEITPQGETLLLRDLNSTNGTYVNGERITGEVAIRAGDLVQFADLVFRLVRDTESFDTRTHQAVDVPMPSLSQIDRLIETEAIIPFYQPIIQLKNSRVVGYEVLARSTIEGLETPDVMFRVASQVMRQHKLSNVCRWRGVSESEPLPGNPNLFLNIHRDEDLMTDVLESLKAIRATYPRKRLTVEIHESVVPGPEQMRNFYDALQDIEMQMAFDDFGVGQSRLLDLVKVPPEILKFDMSLIRDIDQAPERHIKWLRTLLLTTHDLGIRSLAEGIETESEAEVCRDLGFMLAQGYLYGRPQTAQMTVSKRSL